MTDGYNMDATKAIIHIPVITWVLLFLNGFLEKSTRLPRIILTDISIPDINIRIAINVNKRSFFSEAKNINKKMHIIKTHTIAVRKYIILVVVLLFPVIFLIIIRQMIY